MKAVGIRELKDKLSRYIDEVRRGDVILVTDRGVVVAEIRQPSRSEAVLSPLEQRLIPYVERGVISHAAPRDPSLYRRSPVSLPAAAIDGTLEESRADR